MEATAKRSAYADAGVDVGAGERAVELLRQRTAIGRGDLLGRLHGFGSAIAIPAGYRQPVLVSATDGVGTKLEIARQLSRFGTVGRDLVAMCADDVACHGARPLFFLDYVAVGHLIPERLAELVEGIADGCAAAGCSLVGGETAEHPGVMAADALDLAGFCVGVVERDQLLDGQAAREGDVVIGLASSGLHSNGYSLVRQLIDRHGLSLGERYGALAARFAVNPGPDADQTLGDVLLTPTRIYASEVLALREALLQASLRLAGIAHVTGGGLRGNLPRAVPTSLGIEIRTRAWTAPPIFAWLQALGRLSGEELRATFNCGVGMALVVEPAAAQTAIDWLAERQLSAWEIGRVLPAASLGAGRYAEVDR